MGEAFCSNSPRTAGCMLDRLPRPSLPPGLWANAWLSPSTQAPGPGCCLLEASNHASLQTPPLPLLTAPRGRPRPSVRPDPYAGSRVLQGLEQAFLNTQPRITAWWGQEQTVLSCKQKLAVSADSCIKRRNTDGSPLPRACATPLCRPAVHFAVSGCDTGW